MAETTESSVRINLKDLFEMETDRRVQIARTEERRLAEDVARETAEREARTAELDAIEEEARREAKSERAADDAELDSRIASLKSQLGVVQEQREELRTRVLTATAPALPRRSGWFASSMAAASLVAACVAIFVAGPSPHATVVVAPSPAPIVQFDEPEAPVADVTPTDTVFETNIAGPVEVAVVDVAPATPVRVRPTRWQQRQQERERLEHSLDHSLNHGLDFGDDDGLIPDL